MAKRVASETLFIFITAARIFHVLEAVVTFVHSLDAL